MPKLGSTAQRGAVLILLALAAAACGEEEPKLAAPLCLPEPTLRCVTDAAVEALGPALAAGITGANWNPAGFAYIEDLVAAQHKLSDVAGIQRVIDAVRPRVNVFNKLNFAAVLGQAGRDDEARRLFRRSLDEYEARVTQRADTGELFVGRFVQYFGLAMRAGLRGEAKILLRGMIDRDAPALAKLASEDKRMDYLIDAAIAFAQTGDNDGAREFAQRTVAAIAALPKNPSVPLRLHLKLIDGLIEWSAMDVALEVLVTAVPLIPPGDVYEKSQLQHVHRRAMIIFSARKDAVSYAQSRDFLRANRESGPASPWIVQIMDDFDASVASGDLEEARRIRDKAVVRDDHEYDDYAKMLATFGDDAGAIEWVGKVKSSFKTAGICTILAQHGHIAGALRCAVRLTDKQKSWEVLRFRVYSAIAREMAKRQ